MIGKGQRPRRRMKNVGIKYPAGEDAHRIAKPGLHAPAKNPHVEKRIPGAFNGADVGGEVDGQRPGDDERGEKINSRGSYPHAYEPIAARIRSVTSLGSPLPLVSFITWPTRNWNLRSLPARISATMSPCVSTTRRTIGSRLEVSEICAKPSAATISAAARPESYIVANTSFATVELIVPCSTIAIKPASAAGVIGTASISIARSFMLRSTSPMTQLLAAFGLPACFAVASK